MKTFLPILVITLSLFLIPFNSSAQGVGINETGAAPDNSALLDLNSTDKGFLITRVDTANIATPAFGLMTLSPLDTCLYLYNGSAWMGMGGGGSNCSCNCSSPSTSPVFPCGGTVIPIVDVTSPTGKVWMDRNLGASQVATSSTDAASYGDLYQWGRCSDGHEKRTSSTSTTLSVTNTPGNGDFIITTNTPFDWRSPQNTNLWQGVTGTNNPCPTGYRIPTESELEAERLSWNANTAAGAFNSPLKLTLTGSRSVTQGTLGSIGTRGGYWSSTISGTSSRGLYYFVTVANMSTSDRGYGSSVRCIKD